MTTKKEELIEQLLEEIKDNLVDYEDFLLECAEKEIQSWTEEKLKEWIEEK